MDEKQHRITYRSDSPVNYMIEPWAVDVTVPANQTLELVFRRGKEPLDVLRIDEGGWSSLWCEDGPLIRVDGVVFLDLR